MRWSPLLYQYLCQRKPKETMCIMKSYDLGKAQKDNITTDYDQCVAVVVLRRKVMAVAHRMLDPQPQLDQTGSGSSLVRCRSNDKLDSASSSSCPGSAAANHQRGSSLRLPVTHRPHHHHFLVTSACETSTATEPAPAATLKFKHRVAVHPTTAPLIPDRGAISEASLTFTPRPPLSSSSKRLSSDLEDGTSSDVEAVPASASKKPQAPRPPISPTRAILANRPRPMPTAPTNDDSTSPPDTPPPLSQLPPSSSANRSSSSDQQQQKSSLRKQSPHHHHHIQQQQHSSTHNGGISSHQHSQHSVSGCRECESPSPTKSVKWSPNTEVKRIPRSHSWNGKTRPPMMTSQPSSGRSKGSGTACGDSSEDKMANKTLKLSESYIARCTEYLREQMRLLERLGGHKISYAEYRVRLSDSLDQQRRLLSSFQSVLGSGSTDDRSAHSSSTNTGQLEPTGASVAAAVVGDAAYSAAGLPDQRQH